MIRLALHPRAGGWRVEVGDGAGVPTRGVTDAEPVARAMRAAASLAERSAFAVLGDDVARVRAEEEAARLLKAAVLADPAVAERWGALVAAGADAVLVEPTDPDLPFELLEDAPVVRLVPGPEPSQVPTAALVAKARILDPTLAPLVEALGVEEGDGDVLFVAGHGDGGGVRLESGVHAAGTVAADLPTRARLAVLLSCGAGRGGALGPRLVAAGVPAVLAMPGRVPVDAAFAAAEATWGAVAAGESVLGALRRARGAVRRLGDPDPDARWHAVRLFVSGPGALQPLVSAPRRFPGVGADAAALLEQASVRAASWGFVGIEALCEVFADAPEWGRISLWSRAVLPGMRTRVARLSGPASAQPEPTPRLAKLLEAPAGLDAGALAGWLAEVLRPLLGTPEPSDSRTFATENDVRALATALEVVGGPEDGHLLRCEPGRILGRGSGLYQGTALVDARLSRRHLRWEEPGRLTLLAPAGGRAPGVFTVREGDLLEPGGATLLRGRA